MIRSDIDVQTVEAIHRLRHDDDFKRFKDLLEDNLTYMAMMAVKTVGIPSDEYSGGYKVLEALLGVISLDEFKQTPVVSNRFE